MLYEIYSYLKVFKSYKPFKIALFMKPIGTCFKNEFLQEIKFQLITVQNKNFLL